MGFKDLVKQAKAAAKREGEYPLPNQRGRCEVQHFKMFKDRNGNKFLVLLMKLLEVAPKKTGGETQPVGTLIKEYIPLSGNAKKVDVSYSKIKTILKDIYGCADDEVDQALDICFGSAETSDQASDAEKAVVGFAASGFLVDFDTFEVEKDKKKYTRLSLKHIPNQTEADVDARRKAIAA